MTDRLFSRPRRGLALLLPVIAAACTDGTPLTPAIDPVPEPAAVMQCSVDVHSAAMSCAAAEPGLGGALGNRMVGNQDMYVKLTNVGGSYDSGSGLFEINVTLQNLLAAPLGTSDGTTVDGIMVFFDQGPNVTGGTGEVTLLNAGTAFITAANQHYFLYNEILDPYEISAAQPWRFDVPNTVTRFSFMMYVYAPQADESAPLMDRVWSGSAGTAWADGANWVGGVVPDSASSVTIYADSLLASPNMPLLSADAQVTHFRVGFGSTLNLGSNQLTAWGNVDAVGAVTGGSLRVAGAGALLQGNLPSVVVNGSAVLQGATQTSGAVSISGGSLSVSGSTPLSISIP
jgi:hypothetical protein